MPIKFRCHHCRQFLGISRAQAGGIVDCPTCGRTIRVPDLDGTVSPLPRPGLDPQDSKLAAALSELASIGDEDLPAPAEDAFENSPANAERETSMPDSDPEGERPSPLLRNFVVLGPEGEPIDFDALPDPSSIAPVNPEAPPTGGNIGTLDEIPPPGPVEVPFVNPEPAIDPLPPPAADAALPNDDSMKQERPWAETAQPGDSWKKLLADANNQAEDELTEPAPEGRPAATKTNPAQASTAASADGLSTGLWFALLGLGAVLFAAGFLTGRMTTVGGDTPDASPESGTEGEAEGELDSTTGTRETPETQTAGTRVAFRGRITFQADGQRKPDRGARVIVLPKERTGTLKIPVTGFRSGDAEGDQRIAVAALMAMGGAFASASDEGEFEVSLPSSGQFYVLVLSNSVMRVEDAPDPDAEATAGEYFDRPAQLLGRVECYLEEVRWDGDGAEPLDHSFRG
ncbi:MAG: hypothetical protein H8E37_07945 [Planctomycetes bacterium]|nr:hypothetical protein [Planctomycetota bacterium]